MAEPANPTKAYVIPPEPLSRSSNEIDQATQTANPLNAIMAELLRDQIWTAAHTSPRSLQQAVGASQIGELCARSIAYTAAGVAKTNLRDPMRVLAGTGLHAALADLFVRLDGGSGRYLVEQPVSYRGVPGTVDLYDRRKRIVIDWKSALKYRLKDIKAGGPQAKYVVQVQTYGAALAEAGEQVEWVGIAYVVLDGELPDLRVFTFPFDRSAADAAIDRLADLTIKATTLGPAAVEPTPSRLCGWCDHHRPGSTDLNTGCPGQSAS